MVTTHSAEPGVHSSPALARRGSDLLTSLEWECIGKDLGLSVRELDLVRCVFDDLSTTEIAERLGISSNTVHTYFNRLYRKLDLNTRCGLMRCIFCELLRVRAEPHGTRYIETSIV